MACHSWEAEYIPKKMRGFLEFEDEELKFFTRRFFVLKAKKKVLEYYREDPLVNKYFLQYFTTSSKILLVEIRLYLSNPCIMVLVKF